MVRRKQGFWGLVFSSFFRWWCALLTVMATAASYLKAPSDGVHLSALAVSASTLLLSIVVFLAFSAVWQSYLIYRDQSACLGVLRVRPCEEYGGRDMFVLTGSRYPPPGSLVEFMRGANGVEVPIALGEVVREDSDGRLLVRALWFAPIHRNELKKQLFVPSDITAVACVKRETLAHVVAEQGGMLDGTA